MNTKHTPGPWIVANRREADNGINVRTGRDIEDLYIAIVDPMPHYDDRQEANAHLIAAAPEMLEALKSLHAAFNAYPRVVDFARWTRDVEQAIAKAEGRHE